MTAYILNLRNTHRIQVCGGQAAAPSAGLLSGASVLSKMITLSGHSEQKLASCMVKVLKNKILFGAKEKDIHDSGKDAMARLKQDPKLEEIGQACSHLLAYNKALIELRDIRKEHSTEPELAGPDAGDEMSALSKPDDALLKLDLGTMFEAMAPNEIDDVVWDCVEAKFAELITTVEQAAQDPRLGYCPHPVILMLVYSSLKGYKMDITEYGFYVLVLIITQRLLNRGRTQFLVA